MLVKKNIPSTVKNSVWKKRFIGKQTKGHCICCFHQQIEKHTFEIGYIENECDGGNLIIDNLEPICKKCNKDKKNYHLFEFMTEFGMGGLKHIELYDDLYEIYQEWLKKRTDKELLSIIGNKNDHCNKQSVIDTTIDIFDQLKEHNEIQLIAPTQSGKSDIIKRIIGLIRKHENYFETNYGFFDVCVVICASDNDLKRDLTQKINNDEVSIYHLPDILKFVSHNDDATKWKLLQRRILFIFDENHSDTKDNRTVDNFRKKMGMGWNTKWTSSIKILGISATPYEQMLVNIPFIEYKPNKEYYGFTDMLKNNKIKESLDLANYSNIEKVFTPNICKKKGYVLIRLNLSKSIDQNAIRKNIDDFMRKNKIKYDKMIYDMNTNEDINETHLNKKPDILTIIYLKNKLRKGKSIIKTHILLAHDTGSNICASTCVQSLAGRMTGYNANYECIIYCDLHHIEDHIEWIKSGYQNSMIPSTTYIKSNGTLSNDSMYS